MNFNDLDKDKKTKLFLGGLVGLFLGVSTAWTLMNAPSDLEEEEIEPISSIEILNLAGAAATLIRRLDNFRRRM